MTSMCSCSLEVDPHESSVSVCNENELFSQTSTSLKLGPVQFKHQV